MCLLLISSARLPDCRRCRDKSSSHSDTPAADSSANGPVLVGVVIEINFLTRSDGLGFRDSGIQGFGQGLGLSVPACANWSWLDAVLGPVPAAAAASDSWAAATAASDVMPNSR